MSLRFLQKQFFACMITQLKTNFRLSGVQQSFVCRIFSCECSEIIHLLNNNIVLTTTQSICTNKSLPKNKSNTKENGWNISSQFYQRLPNGRKCVNVNRNEDYTCMKLARFNSGCFQMGRRSATGVMLTQF